MELNLELLYSTSRSRLIKMLKLYISAKNRCFESFEFLCVAFLKAQFPKAAKPVNRVPDFISTFLSVNPLDIFKETSGECPAGFVATELGVFNEIS